MISIILLALPVLSSLLTIIYGIAVLRKDSSITNENKSVVKRQKKSTTLPPKVRRRQVNNHEFHSEEISNKVKEYSSLKKWRVRECILDLVFLCSFLVYTIFFTGNELDVIRIDTIRTGLVPLGIILILLFYKIETSSLDFFNLFTESNHTATKSWVSFVPLILVCISPFLWIHFSPVNISELLSFDGDYFQLIFWSVAIFLVCETVIRVILSVWKFNDSQK